MNNGSSNNNQVYEQLARALDRLPNGFPRTSSNVEIRMLQKIFSPEEASIACWLTGQMEPIDTIAQRIGLSAKEARKSLMQMTRHDMVRFEKKDGVPHFRLTPFVVGIYEGHLDKMDHEFAHLLEEYLLDGGAEGLMKMQPALQRVLPVRHGVKSEWILPYDDVVPILQKAEMFNLRDCICRTQRSLVGHRCDFPLHNCLTLSLSKRSPHPNDISCEEALKTIDDSEGIGLVHCVSNVTEGISYICNCCGCCCTILRGITQWGIQESVAQANYYAVIEPEICQSCGTCIERCQVNAIFDNNGISEVQPEKCIGCGLCVTGCPNEAVELRRKGENDIIAPPVDFAEWEKQRILNRSVSGESNDNS